MTAFRQLKARYLEPVRRNVVPLESVLALGAFIDLGDCPVADCTRIQPIGIGRNVVL